MGDCAGATQTVFAPALGGSAAVGAFLRAAVGEILAMLQPVAFDAKSLAISNIKAGFRVISPGMNVVGVKLAHRAASPAGVIVSFIDCLAPCFQSCAQASPLAMERLPVLIGITAGAATGARPRTKALLTLVGGKRCLASWADAGARRVAAPPAVSGAVARRFGAVSFHFKRRATEDAGLCYTSSRCHGQSVARHASEPKYVAVILERCADMGLSPRLVTKESGGG